MLRTQKVIDGLDGVEGAQWNLNEDGVPVTHGAVPETGQFQSLELTAVLGLAGYEAGGGIYVLGQVKLVTLVSAQGANQVYRVEVGTLGEHLLLGGVIKVYL